MSAGERGSWWEEGEAQPGASAVAQTRISHPRPLHGLLLRSFLTARVTHSTGPGFLASAPPVFWAMWLSASEASSQVWGHYQPPHHAPTLSPYEEVFRALLSVPHYERGRGGPESEEPETLPVHFAS